MLERVPTHRERARIRRLIITCLRRQGFAIRDGRLVLPGNEKMSLRRLNRMAVEHRIAQARERLQPYEDRLLSHIASGHEIEPARVTPRLVEVQPDSEDELLFRYVSLHWSIPTSSGYGRRLRFLVEDAHNGSLNRTKLGLKRETPVARSAARSSVLIEPSWD